jgi:hypothetical protein
MYKESVNFELEYKIKHIGLGLAYVCVDVFVCLMTMILFQDEIDCLQREIEELKSKNLSLESQIKTILDPLTTMQGNQNEEKHPIVDIPSKIDQDTVAEWKKKLRTASEIYEKVKDDVDKLKEVSCRGFEKPIGVVV